MKIGEIKLKNNVFLAPMAGVTDVSFRIICKEMGVGLLYTEMISSKGLFYNDKKTEELTLIDRRERPIAMQIFGSDPCIMAKIVEEKLNNREDIDIIDINMGCPAPKIVKNGDGSALLKDPSLVGKIVHEVVKVSKKPITVKIRKGWDSSSINAVDIAKIVEKEGASAITVHGRTRDMFYSGEADWDIIGEVKSNVKIPVIGNGDIFTPEDGIRMLKHTKCDGIMVGRGSRGNPWLIKNIIELINGKDVVYPSYEDKIKKAIEHLELLCQFKDERIAVREMRKHIAWYIKGIKDSARIKNQVNTIETVYDMKKLLIDYVNAIKY
ncbi:tRNA dihydrouridine synthase DusB [Anaerosalibacter sp. Marseille-P3206]|uniref:tRNA dihydrouridine synthase DusB n=1 Tax=Anaerosalibacter sp. Marseille-P3206 TaxID=1871005 RepID=UPI0009870CAC|nr:tRNA dihydrouridine synthase DusB [Anaerosalibacter sp. Marseille-P3206]